MGNRRGRERADPSQSSSASESNPKKKGRDERLIDSGRAHSTVGSLFVSGDHDLSPDLVSTLSSKACQFIISFVDDDDDINRYYGHGQAA